MPVITENQGRALHRLIDIARRDTGQSKKVASFLLAWWNAEQLGGFDLTDLWAVDAAIEADMLDVIALIAANRGKYPNDFGLTREFQEIIKVWHEGTIVDKPRL